ncbi:hypothetical protein V5O48_013276, partial [Marasmius crinis-equi]
LFRSIDEISITKIQTFRYESSSGRDGAAEFLHIMHKVLGRIGDSSESQQTPFITLHMHIDRVKDDIKATADGALTLSAEVPEDEVTDGGKLGEEDDTTLILHSESDSSSLGIITRNHGPPGSPQIKRGRISLPCPASFMQGTNHAIDR